MRWRLVWNRAGGGAGSGDDAYTELSRCYRAAGRAYHTLTHVAECLAELDRALAAAASVAEHPDEAELALWLHDVVYDSRAENNEKRSAAWADAALGRGGMRSDVRRRVSNLILATTHTGPVTDRDERLVADADLSILGQPADKFSLYERGIRAEYDWVPDATYRQRRAAVLRGFLERDRIYATDYFASKYEAVARNNLRRSVARLESAA